jgi:threonine 3-dehydrogenase
MKALLKGRFGRGIQLEDVPVPAIGKDDVLIKIIKNAICGTDLHIYEWDSWAARTIKPPLIIGHEYVGVIVDRGINVRHLDIGLRVTGEGHTYCGHCRNCRRGKLHVCENSVGIGVNRDGAMAEYLSLPASNVIVLDDRIPDDVAAIMDPFGNATHTAFSFPLLGEDVLITGAGLIGCMATAITRFAGARHVVVTDVNGYRLDLARKMGATRAVNPANGERISDVMRELGIRGFDVGLEMSGSSQAFDDMLDSMYNGSSISLLGILPDGAGISWSRVIFKALTLKGIYGRSMWETWYKMQQMLLAGLDISPVITHRFGVDDFQRGFDVMESGCCGKVLLEW